MKLCPGRRRGAFLPASALICDWSHGMSDVAETLVPNVCKGHAGASDTRNQTKERKRIRLHQKETKAATGPWKTETLDH